MTTHMVRRHWLERCAVQDEHWDQSPWPAQMAQMDSDTEQDDDDDEEEEERWLPRQRPARRTIPAQDSRRAPSKPAEKPLTPIRSTSHRQHKSMSEIAPRRRHVRSQSIPEPAAGQLHIDTILPLQLPPTNLCTLSPLSTYPTPWWPSTSEESLRRSDSTNSFLSASSDGSWHGDHGDQDPNGQLERAISQLSISSSSCSTSLRKEKIHSGLILSTYDYQDEDDIFESSHEHTEAEADDNNDDTEAEAIRLHAGPLINNVASFFLEVLTSYYTNDDASSSSSTTLSSIQKGTLIRSQSDCALYGSISSTHDLGMESNMLHHHRRQRAGTMPSKSAARRQQIEEASTSSLQSLLQWFLPNVDDKLERELLGHHEPRPRLDSIPSLYSDTSDTEREDSEDEDDDDDDKSITPGPLHIHRQMDFDQGPMYDYNVKGRRSSVSKSLKRSSLSVLDTSGAPSPLWDNRLVEEPYQRSWSSVMNLASL